MKTLLHKYAQKLVDQGLCSHHEPLFAALDVYPIWNRADDPRQKVLEPLLQTLGVTSLLLAQPTGPYKPIMDFLATRYPQRIKPRDCETRTFLHDIPVCADPTDLLAALAARKAAFVPGLGIVAKGDISPEQCFVHFSSVCFACFVLFFSEYITTHGSLDPAFHKAFLEATSKLPAPPENTISLVKGPFKDEKALLAAMKEAGKAVVEYGLVDSFFGNVSVLHNNTVYISQTGSSLDELAGCIDPCPQDKSACTGLTASSELSAHERTYAETDACCILHGHPRFTVIMSMLCEDEDCLNKDQCHTACIKDRQVANMPIVPGEVGTGPTGLCNTLPRALKKNSGAIVLGHGLFATGTADFNNPFFTLLEVENRCRAKFFADVAKKEKEYEANRGPKEQD